MSKHVKMKVEWNEEMGGITTELDIKGGKSEIIACLSCLINNLAKEMELSHRTTLDLVAKNLNRKEKAAQSAVTDERQN